MIYAVSAAGLISDWFWNCVCARVCVGEEVCVRVCVCGEVGRFEALNPGGRRITHVDRQMGCF